MTTLTDPMIGDVCRHAGFVGPELVTAIATALASSGGVPSYRHEIWPGPAARYEGLWGLDTVQWPDHAARPLDNPYEAARAARELTDRGDFSWCPAWRAGTDRAYEGRARAAAGRLPHREAIELTNSVPTARRRVAQESRILGAHIDAITRHTTGG